MRGLLALIILITPAPALAGPPGTGPDAITQGYIGAVLSHFSYWQNQGVESRAEAAAFFGEMAAYLGFRSGEESLESNRTHTQLTLFASEREIWIVFRGTEPDELFYDGLTSLKCWSRPETGMHAGYAGAVESVLGGILNFISVYPGRPVILAGHSLGGGLALTASRMLTREGVDVRSVHVYGSPSSGDERQIRWLNEAPFPVHRWVNGADPIVLASRAGASGEEPILHIESDGRLGRHESVSDDPHVCAKRLRLEDHDTIRYARGIYRHVTPAWKRRLPDPGSLGLTGGP